MPLVTPSRTGTVTRSGVQVVYDVYDRDAPTLVLLPTWSILDSRVWKAQIPFLSRHWRLVVVEGRGCGRSDRPRGPEHYDDLAYVDDVLAVMDDTGTDRAVMAAISRGGKWAALLAAQHPERVDGAIFIAPGVTFTPHPVMTPERFGADVEDPRGWDRFNARYWLGDWAGWVEFFMGRVLDAPYSSKAYEDAVAWAMEATPEVIVDTMRSRLATPVDWEEVAGAISCPTLVLHGRDDAVNPYAWGRRLAELAGSELVTYETAVHGLQARWPVDVNRRIDEFARRATRRTGRPPGPGRHLRRQRRMLYLSSPIGLGHVRRDLAIADELRHRHDVEIDWLAQDPVTRVLADAGEHIHPASRWLASESSHLTRESEGHDLHVMSAYRNMDDILVANFHVFQEVVESGGYDLVVGDEAWEVDHFWHEHPTLKRASFAWLTDFVGFLPVDDDPDEQQIAAELNAEMIDHVTRHRRVRDRAVFVGDPEDVIPARFGPGMDDIRGWVTEHFDFSGYITGFDPHRLGDRDTTRRQLGYAPDRPLVAVTVGGSGVGEVLLQRMAQLYPALARELPGLQLLLVAGPRIDPGELATHDGLLVREYVPDLHHHLSVCDLAVVQGGLTTTMELTATGIPFIYVPLARHFEQQIHVPHRLHRHQAGIRVDPDDADPDHLLDLVTTHAGSTPTYRPVPSDGAARAADLIAELL